MLFAEIVTCSTTNPHSGESLGGALPQPTQAITAWVGLPPIPTEATKWSFLIALASMGTPWSMTNNSEKRRWAGILCAVETEKYAQALLELDTCFHLVGPH